MNRFRRWMDCLRESFVADEPEGGFAMSLFCKWCKTRPSGHSVVEKNGEVVNLCSECCTRRMEIREQAKALQDNLDLRWMEASYIAPSSQRNR